VDPTSASPSPDLEAAVEPVEPPDEEVLEPVEPVELVASLEAGRARRSPDTRAATAAMAITRSAAPSTERFTVSLLTAKRRVAVITATAAAGSATAVASRRGKLVLPVSATTPDSARTAKTAAPDRLNINRETRS
jgi:hypothetical protein